ncbi:MULTISPECIES: hypothetical protein [Anaerostipes]|uniref:Uncharacterized protein n=1 Tax=Anaerostipes rhamnosivorans TaxID=1229621 RepID=A0A4P8IIF7_9FIRM|nr:MULTISPECIES: hypothetical protein [Anaerostipes]QCP34949.1 hypothetical protein AR1Y2_1495 [Anaerostipes rhamnosivorans]CDC34733.1 unknown [Anaerostipes sp. CAG:276]
MFTFLEKISYWSTKQIYKIPQAMIVILIFTTLFQNEAATIKNILSSKIQMILPESTINFFTELNLSQKDLLTIWAFLLVTHAITFALTALEQFSKDYDYIIIGSGGAVLFHLNSIILLTVLIYNSLYSPRIMIHSVPVHFTGLYYPFVIVSAGLFASIFCVSYCANLLRLLIKINDKEFPLKKRIVLDLTFGIIVIYFFSNLVKFLPI